jgi:hypothetical protein
VRRGFKAQAERLALAERKTLGLTARCRLDAVQLAAAHRIDVIDLSALLGLPEQHRRQLLEVATAAFSGASVIRGQASLVVINDAHTPERQANTTAHEIAHFLLDHPPVTRSASSDGRCRRRWRTRPTG